MPNGDLRRAVHASPEDWGSFRRRCLAALAGKDDLVRTLIGHAREGVVTLIHAARDEDHNNALMLRDHLVARLRGKEAER